MLTGKHVRVRHARAKLLPMYIDTAQAHWIDAAERLLDVFRGVSGRTRGELDDELAEVLGDDPATLVQQGLAKLLEDRCEFETVSGHPPEELREAAFGESAMRRIAGTFD